MTTSPTQAVSTVALPLAEPPGATAPAIHRTPPAGLQSYQEPNADGALAQFVAGDSDVPVIGRLGAWAEIQVGASTVWVDGRALIPDTAAATNPTTTSPYNVWSLLSGLAGVGVIVGAVLKWFSSGSVNSFDVPVPSLFDFSTVKTDPKVGYFLVGFGIVAILTSFSARVVWVRRIVGALALATAVLFCYQIQDSISSFSYENFSRVVGAGVWVVGASGVLLVVLPGPKRVDQQSAQPDPSAPQT